MTETRTCEKQLDCEYYNYLGAMADLDAVLEVIFEHLKGQRSKLSILRFLEWNYPKEYAKAFPKSNDEQSVKKEE